MLQSVTEQLVYIHLKVLITRFQKMIWFLGAWATVHEVLPTKFIKKNADSAGI